MNDLFPHLHNDEALRLLKASLKLTKRKERMKEINRALRKADRTGNDRPLVDMGFDADYIAALKEPGATGTRGIHPVRIAACGKRIRKIRDQIYDDFGLRIDGNKLVPAHPTTATQNTQELFGEVRLVDKREEESGSDLLPAPSGPADAQNAPVLGLPLLAVRRGVSASSQPRGASHRTPHLQRLPLIPDRSRARSHTALAQLHEPA